MNLAEIQTDCRELTARLDALYERTDEPSLRERILAAKERASKTLAAATSPVRIACVADFSAGKSRLIEALLGCGGALPVAEGPSTGNVVEFRIHRDPAAASTSVTGSAVRFMSRTEGYDFLQAIKQRADNLTETEAPATLERLRRLQPGAPTVWARAQEWAIEAHEQAATNALKDMSFELYRLAKVYAHCGPVLVGQTFPVTPDGARAAMTAERQLADYREIDLNQLPEPPRLTADRLPEALTPPVLARLFPLVAKVVLDVAVPAPVFDLFQSGVENMYTLVDSPGLGSAGASLRDELLCMRELADVETVMVLLDARQPGSAAGKRMYDLMYRQWKESAKDRLLAVISRFDQLPLDNQNNRAIRDAIADGQGPLLEADVLDELTSTLGAAIESARATVADSRPDRIVLCSSMVHLAHLSGQFKDLRLGTEAFLQDELAPAKVEHLLGECAPWARIGARLAAAAEPGAYLADYLEHYARDGGVDRLRRLIREHLDEHGLAQLQQKVAREHDALRQVVDELEQFGAPEPAAAATKTPGASPAAVLPMRPRLELQAAVRELSRIYTSFATGLERSPPRLQTHVEGVVEPVAVEDDLDGQLIERIMGWQEWTSLLESVDPLRDPGQIAVRATGQGEDEVPDLLRDLLPTANEQAQYRFPTKSSDFWVPFEGTMQQLNRDMQSLCAAAIDYLLDDLKLELENRLGVRRDEVWALVEDASGRIRETSPHWYAYISLARDPSRLAAELAKKMPVPEEIAPDELRAAFPLPLEDSEGRVALTYPWEAEVARTYHRLLPPYSRHQIRVLQTRHVLIESARRYLARALGEIRRTVRDQLLVTFRHLSYKLEEVADALR